MEEKVFRVGVDSAGVLSKAVRMFNGTYADIVRELLQNARRSGADKAWVGTHESGNSSRVFTVEHNGAGFTDTDVEALLCFGGSGWDGAAAGEDPAGMGFFSMGVFDRIHIVWRTPGEEGYRKVFVRGKALGEEGAVVVVERLHDACPLLNEEATVGFSVVCAEDAVAEGDIGQACMNSLLHVVLESDTAHDTPVTYDYQELFKERSVYEREASGCLFIVASWSRFSGDGGVRLGYPTLLAYGSSVRLAESRNPRFDTSMAMYIVAGPSSGVRMTLPARDRCVEDEAYDRLLDEARKTWALYGEETQAPHRMPFSAYEKYRKLAPGFPEASADLVLPAKALMYPERHTWVREGKPQSGDSADYALALLQASDLKNLEFTESDLRDYAGYSWADAFIARGNVLPYFTVDDVTLMVGDKPIADVLREGLVKVNRRISFCVRGEEIATLPAVVFEDWEVRQGVRDDAWAPSLDCFGEYTCEFAAVVHDAAEESDLLSLSECLQEGAVALDEWDDEAARILSTAMDAALMQARFGRVECEDTYIRAAVHVLRESLPLELQKVVLTLADGSEMRLESCTDWKVVSRGGNFDIETGEDAG